VTASPDVAVVGAGVVGLSIAWHLAGHGASVVVVERSGIGAGASGVQPGGVRCQWATRLNCLLAQESLGFYRELGERLETRIRPRFTACGYAFVAHSEARLADLADAVRLQRSLGVPSRILSPGETAEIVPELDPSEIAGASWCAEDGYFDRAQEPVEAFGESAVARGVELVVAEAISLDPVGSGWSLATTAGPIEAARVVVAAGCDSVPLLRSVGFEAAIAPERRFLFLSDPVSERLLEPLVIADEIGLAAKQLADGRVLASDLRAEGDPEANAALWRRNVRSGLEALLPRLTAVDFRQLVDGVYDVTPDHNPLVGPVADGVWSAAGFSGHGFMLAPAIGRLVGSSIVTAAVEPMLAELSPGRFEGATPVAETAIV
jgi:sarcosine oxidase, subunit beta